jgi:PhnB protein
MAVKPIPQGYHSVTPYLIVKGAAAAIEIKIGDSVVMLADENPEMGASSPQTVGGSPVSILLYVEDVDSVVNRAVTAGAKLTRPVEDQFYGDRAGSIQDPFGHSWYIHTHKEDVSPEEMQKRMAARG